MDNAASCGGLEKDALLAYLYDECEPDERERVAAHLAVCGRCAAEADAFQSLRGSLAAWDVPAAPSGIRVVSERDARPAPWWSFALRPAFGLAAAARLVLGIGLALGGVEMRPVDGGFVVHFGDAVQPDVPAPWRMELARLESQLRSELKPAEAPTPVQPDALLEHVRGLISQSEQRQQQERALWLTEFAQELDMQRRADQQQIQQELGALEGVADYLVRVSQR